MEFKRISNKEVASLFFSKFERRHKNFYRVEIIEWLNEFSEYEIKNTQLYHLVKIIELFTLKQPNNLLQTNWEKVEKILGVKK
jgi:hypothetical protein